MVNDFERKSVMRKRKILLHKRLRQRNLFYAFCLTLKVVQILSVEPTVFLLLSHKCLYKVYSRSRFDIHDFTISAATILCATLTSSALSLRTAYMCALG